MVFFFLECYDHFSALVAAIWVQIAIFCLRCLRRKFFEKSVPDRPVRIDVSVGVNDVTNIVESDSTLTVNLNLQLAWTDSRLNISSR
jgi:hypothetical protein